MKVIKELSEMISEEIDDAEKYIRHAIECKDTDRQLANTFAELSNHRRIRESVIPHYYPIL